MTTLYRAHQTNAAHVAGTCWTARQEHAEAYLDNGQYGGPVLYAVDTEARHVLDLTGPRLIAELAEALADHDDLVVTAEQWCGRDDDTEGLRGVAALREWLRGVVAGSDKGRGYSAWEERPAVWAALREDYDWVTYDDDYPVGCVTWCYLGEIALPARVVA